MAASEGDGESRMFVQTTDLSSKTMGDISKCAQKCRVRWILGSRIKERGKLIGCIRANPAGAEAEPAKFTHPIARLCRLPAIIQY